MLSAHSPDHSPDQRRTSTVDPPPARGQPSDGVCLPRLPRPLRGGGPRTAGPPLHDRPLPRADRRRGRPARSSDPRRSTRQGCPHSRAPPRGAHAASRAAAGTSSSGTTRAGGPPTSACAGKFLLKTPGTHAAPTNGGSKIALLQTSAVGDYWAQGPQQLQQQNQRGAPVELSWGRALQHSSTVVLMRLTRARHRSSRPPARRVICLLARPLGRPRVA